MDQNIGRENNPSNRVFVGGISWKADESSLANFFSAYGKVVECKIIMDKVTGKSKGYGFVTFEDPQSATIVKQTSNLHFLGKMMNVGDAVRKNDFQSTESNRNAQNVQPYQMQYGYNQGPAQFYPSANYYPQQGYGYVPLSYAQYYEPMYVAAQGQSYPMMPVTWPTDDSQGEQNQTTEQLPPDHPFYKLLQPYSPTVQQHPHNVNENPTQ
eukprot:TRINITY_DN9229_c0_g1_i2.p1 TRINITY_DN9229_c0_g1~~TRINITY_DN9229_c0_g1_i2.p1  ORF type:complete len:211 (+),score=43.88 TRINITY_DN9229_c0_g1_i2:127-759(+)